METLLPTPLRVLVVDDQKSVLFTLDYLFSERGHRVATAESGPAALALASQQSFDAVLIDLHMPGMDGTQVCRRLLAQSIETHCPVAIWMMTAAYTTEAARIAADAGALGLFKKPFDWAEVCRQIEQGPRCSVVPFAPPPAAMAITG